MKYYVLIKDYETDSIVKKMGPMPERKADRVYSGASANLNHDDYFVVQVSENEFEAQKEKVKS